MASKPTPGVVVRHARSCTQPRDHKPNADCTPTYEAWVWDAKEAKKIRRPFPTLAAAKLWRSDAVPQARKGQLQAPLRKTLKQVGDEFLSQAGAGVALTKKRKPYAAETIATYSGDLRNHVYPVLGSARLEHVTRADWQRFVDALLADGMPGDSVLRIVTAGRVVTRYAITRHGLLTDPMRYLELPAAGKGRERAAFPVEAETLLNVLPPELQALYATAMYATLRRGELRGLQWDDVATDFSTITVRRAWDRLGEKETKTAAGMRTIPVFAPLRYRLENWQLESGRGGRDLVFGRTASEPFTPTKVRKQALGVWASVAVGAFLRGRSSVVEPIGLHECRHSAKSMMREAGIAEEYVDLYMGHSRDGVSARYWHAGPTHLADNAKLFNEYHARVTGAHTGAQRTLEPLKAVA